MVALQILVLTVGVRILLGEIAADAAFCFENCNAFASFTSKAKFLLVLSLFGSAADKNASLASKIKLVRKNCKIFASFAAFCGTQKCEFHEQSKTRNKKITK